MIDKTIIIMPYTTTKQQYNPLIGGGGFFNPICNIFNFFNFLFISPLYFIILLKIYIVCYIFYYNYLNYLI
jgi:hypothetical protein